MSASPFSTRLPLLRDTTPTAFSFTDQTNVALSTVKESAAITVAGLADGATRIVVSGGEYQINGGSWVSTAGTVVNGDTVKVRHTSSGSYSTAVNTVLTIGTVSDTFTTTTIPDPTPAYVAKGSVASATSTSISPALPGGWTAGQLAIAYATTYGNVTLSAPAGWTVIGGSQNSGISLRAWYRVLQAGDTAPSITRSGSDVIGGQVFTVSGDYAGGGTPVEGVAGQSGTDDLVTFSALTTTDTARLGVGIWGIFDTGKQTTPPSGWTEREDIDVAAGATIGFMTRAIASATTIASADGGDMGTSEDHNSLVFAIFSTPAGGGVTGSMAATESGSDVYADTGSTLVSGALVVTEGANDIASASGGVEAETTAVVGVQESGSDTASFSGGVKSSGSFALNESGADTATATGGVNSSGTLAVTESGADTIVTSGGNVTISGTLAATEGANDITSGSGGVEAETLAVVGVQETGGDTAAATGGVNSSGALTVTETGADTSSATGGVNSSGPLTVTETGGDIASGSGGAEVEPPAAVGILETGSDTATATGGTLVSGALVVTEGTVDTFAGTGPGSGEPTVEGSMAATESGSDTFASTGAVVVTGSFALTETGQDIGSASGSVEVETPLVGVQETGSDSFAATGGATVVSGALVVTEAGLDDFTGTGPGTYVPPVQPTEPERDSGRGRRRFVRVVPPLRKITGVMAATEGGQDIFSASGYTTPLPPRLALEPAIDLEAPQAPWVSDITLPEPMEPPGVVTTRPKRKGAMAATEGGVDAASGVLTVAVGVELRMHEGDFPDTIYAEGDVTWETRRRMLLSLIPSLSA